MHRVRRAASLAAAGQQTKHILSPSQRPAIIARFGETEGALGQFLRLGIVHPAVGRAAPINQHPGHFFGRLILVK